MDLFELHGIVYDSIIIVINYYSESRWIIESKCLDNQSSDSIVYVMNVSEGDLRIARHTWAKTIKKNTNSTPKKS